MSFKPLNRHLLIEPIEAEKEEAQPAVLLPEGYKSVSMQPHTPAKVIKTAEDCKPALRSLSGESIMVESSMIQEINFEDSIFYLVLENYVLGVVE